VSHAATLRALAAAPGCLQVPGVYDGLSALLVERAGFPAAFLSGASLSFTRFGRPDLGLVCMDEVVQAIGVIRERTALPLIVDADTGFGNALNVQRTVREFEKAGASAIQLEDQLAPKRCGHMAGKQVVPAAEMLGKLRAALDARRDPATIVIARTDALGVEGFQSALDRAVAYAEAGADWVFVEGPDTVEQMRSIAAAVARPLVHNLVEGGRTPVTRIDQLAALGYRIGLHPAFLVNLFAAAAPAMLAQLRADGTSDAMRDRLLDLGRVNALLGADELLADAARYA
jgi:2-methylisocitrate lyase-like PEP mutase family enzyme